LYYLRTKDHAEIDLIVEYPNRKTMLVKIKSTTHADERDIATLARFLPDFPNATGMVVSNDPVQRVNKGIWLKPWNAALKDILGWTQTGLIETLVRKGYKQADNLDYYHPRRHIIVTDQVIVFADRDVDFTQLDLDASKVIYSGGPLKDPDEVARNRFDDQRLSGFKNVVVCLSFF
jgi:hypothetical protein